MTRIKYTKNSVIWDCGESVSVCCYTRRHDQETSKVYLSKKDGNYYKLCSFQIENKGKLGVNGLWVEHNLTEAIIDVDKFCKRFLKK